MKKILTMLAIATIPATLGGCAACCPPPGTGLCRNLCATLCPCCPFQRPAPVVPVAPAPICPPAPTMAAPMVAPPMMPQYVTPTAAPMVAPPMAPPCAVWDPCSMAGQPQFQPAMAPQATFPSPFPAAQPQQVIAQPTQFAEPGCGIAYAEPDCAGPMMGNPHGGIVGYSPGMEYVVWPGGTVPNGMLMAPAPESFADPQPAME